MRNFELCSICENQRLPLRKSARTSIMFFLAEERRLNRRVALKLLLIFSLFIFHFSLIGQSLPDSGFTNKAEAKNVMVNGMKEGKWMEYMEDEIDAGLMVTADTNAPYYKLSEYKSDKPNGKVRIYYKSGKLEEETPYINGKINGMEIQYYESGKIAFETPFLNGKENGVNKCYSENGNVYIERTYSKGKLNGINKEYYESGKLKSETPFSNDKANGIARWYYEDGKIQREYHFKNNNDKEMINYDGNGKEIKLPEFIIDHSELTEWGIVNNSDSSELLNLDTLKLTYLSADIKNSNLWFTVESCSFEFCTNGRSAEIKDNYGVKKAVVSCSNFRSGTWEFNPLSNTLSLYIKNSNPAILVYTINDYDYEDLLLIKKK